MMSIGRTPSAARTLGSAGFLTLLAFPSYAENRYEQMQILDKGLICLMVEYASAKMIEDRTQGMEKQQAIDQANGLLRPILTDIVEAAYDADLDTTTSDVFSQEWRQDCDTGMQAAQQPIYSDLDERLARGRSGDWAIPE